MVFQLQKTNNLSHSIRIRMRIRIRILVCCFPYKQNNIQFCFFISSILNRVKIVHISWVLIARFKFNLFDTEQHFIVPCCCHVFISASSSSSIHKRDQFILFKWLLSIKLNEFFFFRLFFSLSLSRSQCVFVCVVVL